MTENYSACLDKIINKIEQTKATAKPKLLLHACCAPCSSFVIETLFTDFDITILFYNPNIHPREEYDRRLSELQDFVPKLTQKLLSKINIIEAPYNPKDFYNALDIINNPTLATEPEKGERCRRCYELRLKATINFAEQHHFDFFCTTLSISPFKDAIKINTIAKELENKLATNVKWLPSDFKKKNGFKRSLELSKEYNLYRQQYCGCIYSIKNNQPFMS